MLRDFFQGYLDYMKATGLTKKTVGEHARFIELLDPLIGGKELGELNKAVCADIMEAGRKHGRYGHQRALVTFRRFFAYLEDINQKLPFKWEAIKIPNVPAPPVEFLTAEEIETLRIEIDTSDLNGLRMRALVELILATGLRIGEASNLKKKDIDYENKEIKVLNCKTKEWGKVFLTDQAIIWLQKYLEKRKDNLPYLFMANNGRLTENASKINFMNAFKNLFPVKRVTHTILRRTMATTLLNNNVNLKNVQYLMRHKSERTTIKHYIGLDNKLAIKEHNRVLEKI